EEAITDFNERIRVELYGQELNPESFAICKSDMLVTGHNPQQIAFGNTLIDDAHADRSFHYMLSNPPMGWTGRSTRTRSRRKRRPWASRVALAPACRAFPTGSFSSCST